MRSHLYRDAASPTVATLFC